MTVHDHDVRAFETAKRIGRRMEEKDKSLNERRQDGRIKAQELRIETLEARVEALVTALNLHNEALRGIKAQVERDDRLK